MSQNLRFKTELQDQGIRLDKFLMARLSLTRLTTSNPPLILSSSNGLAEKMPEYSRAEIQKMIKENNILINDKKTKSSYKIKIGDIIEIKPPENKIDISPDPSVKFDIIHDEKDFAIIDKPAGLVVYPGIKHEEKTLVNGLLAIWPEIKNVGDPPTSLAESRQVGGLRLRPGIVHRLDKDTSGLMIVAKNNTAFEYFKKLFKNRQVKKTYLALVHGTLTPQEGVIDFPIRRSAINPVKQVAVKEKSRGNNARPALTRFIVIKYLKDAHGNEYTLVEAMPETGRMHQIRVHFAALGHNVVGDKIYLSKKTQTINAPRRHFLHAANVSFVSPAGKNVKYSSDLPKNLNDFLKTLTSIQS